MRVGFEALAWGRHINDYRQAWEAVRHADHEHVGLILDSLHMLARRLPVDDIGQIPAQRIVRIGHVGGGRVRQTCVQWCPRVPGKLAV